MKDALLLLVTGVACSFFSWAFWHLLANDALNVVITLALVGVVADNYRLRRQLRARGGR
jgi:hypothetical protein